MNKKGLKMQTTIKAGGLTVQHNRRVLAVRTGVRAGGFCVGCGNHNRRGLKVTNTGIRCGGLDPNHTRNLLK